MLHEQDKITSIEKMDKLIWAEIPDKQQHPVLHDIICESMMHGPCIQEANCMQKDGVNCSKKFPKEFSEESYLVDNGYPKYRRPNNGRHITIKGVPLDNRYVVPYSQYLSLK